MQNQSKIDETLKRKIVEEVLSGVLNKEEARRKYNIKGKSAILNWIRKFDQSKQASMKSKSPSNNKSQREQELEFEVKRLREELEMEQLRVRALNIMIDVAETQLNVPIRKKPGTKQ